MFPCLPAFFSFVGFGRSRRTSPLPLALTCAAVGVVGVVLLAGCGGGYHESTTDVQGIVLTYPETLTGTVTEADLTPVGAGVTIGTYALYGDGYGTPTYYKNHDYPQTDANGRFTLKYDADAQQASVYATDVCSDTPAVNKSDDGSIGGYYIGSDPPSHGAYPQLENAGKLGDAIKVKYHVASVIVISSRADACQVVHLSTK